MLEFLHIWALDGAFRNPPNAYGLPSTLNYLQQYAADMAYVTPQLANERRTTYKRCIYDNPLRMANNGAESFDLRIVRKRPDIDWQREWTNIHTSGVSAP